ncbi:MAG: LysE family translocator [Burkholderiales bacterium]|jgi:threonine/homoserine/homoserine lactone efflux protein|nr:LysE family translocator [Burkholderiales bacterium]
MNELLPLFTYSLVMSSTPGPNNIMLTASGAKFGYRRSLPHILGIAAGHGPQIFLTCMGLGALFESYPGLHQILRIAGALYLFVIAWQLAGSSIGNKDMQRPLSFWQALAFQAVNPKGWVKAVTVAAVFMPQGMGLFAASLLVTAISIAVNLPCVSMWTLFGVAIRSLLTDPRHQRAFNVIMAALLVIIAILLIV